MTEFKKLSDEELKKVDGGINWQKFGQCILNNGGGSVPELAELVAAIVSCNWPMVAILAATNVEKTNPLIVKCWQSS